MAEFHTLDLETMMTTCPSERRWEGLNTKPNADKIKWPACKTRLVLLWSRTHLDAEYCGPARVKIQGSVWAMTQLQWPWPSPELLRVAAHNQVCALAGIAVSQPGELSLPGQCTTQLLLAVCLQTGGWGGIWIINIQPRTEEGHRREGWTLPACCLTAH